MAQTRRKRRTKHRGTAAGTVVQRGRTGRKPTEDERKTKTSSRDQTRERRGTRLDRPPTWKGAFQRSAVATVFFVLLTIVLLKGKPAAAAPLAVFVLVFYAGMGYYTDLFLYRRRQKRKAQGKA